jgi:hypothetical protein
LVLLTKLHNEEKIMSSHKKVTLPVYELGMIAGTRALLGLGIGLLIGEHLDRHQRLILGSTLTLVGAISTIPLGMDVLTKAGILNPSQREPDFNRLSEFAGRVSGR